MHGPALRSFGLLQLKGCNRWSKLLKYSKLNNQNIVKRERKWEDRMGIRNRSINWKKIYRINEQIKFCNTLRFFHLILIKDNIETNTRSVHYRSPSDLCTFCNRERETSYHLFWNCDIVRNFRNEVFNSIANHNFKIALNSVPNNAKSRIIGTHAIKADNFAFVFFLCLNRYLWITKLREGQPNIIAFKNHFNSFAKLQMSAKILRCFRNLKCSRAWQRHYSSYTLQILWKVDF